MPIDGCEHSFLELAKDVFPSYMSTLREEMTHPIPMADFGIKGVGPMSLQRRFGLDHDPSGCYVLIDGWRSIYVGISRGVLKRIRNHVRGSTHYAATLAYRIAATQHPHVMTASQAMQDTEFQMRFQESRNYLMSLTTAFVEIANPLELYLFEAYCAMELSTGSDTGGWNTFLTH